MGKVICSRCGSAIVPADGLAVISLQCAGETRESKRTLCLDCAGLVLDLLQSRTELPELVTAGPNSRRA